jgi:hypothetical protein
MSKRTLPYKKVLAERIRILRKNLGLLQKDLVPAPLQFLS